MNKRLQQKRLAQTVAVFGALCAFLLICHRDQAKEERLQERGKSASGITGMGKESAGMPKQDADGYYLLSTKEDFRWFVSRHRDPHTNVRLANDLILNDTEGWENWADSPPENSYGTIPFYYGHFDGNGHALVGYYTSYGSWLSFIFTVLEEDARVTDLTIKNSLFRTTYEECAYEDESGKTDVVTASALCFANYGVIENCEVEAKVIGAWDAGGIAGINYGQMRNCKFTGTVGAGCDHSTEAPDNTYTKRSIFAGGICRYNLGSISNCVNEGNVTLDAISDTFYVHEFIAGAILGYQTAEGSIEDCRNMGNVECVGLAGGIVGGSRGGIYRCQNSGDVHIEQMERDYVETLIGAGVCASNGGTVDTCVNTGAVTISQKVLSFRTPIYGVACNTVDPDKGTVENSFYLKEKTSQVYPQRGVRGLSADEMPGFAEYFTGKKRLEREDFADILCFAPYDPEKAEEGADDDGTKEESDTDYVHLGFGPPEDVEYEVKAGDSLWMIAREFFGDGRYYQNLEWANPQLAEKGLLPGMKLTVPHRDLAAVRRYDEEGFGWGFCGLSSGETFPTRYVLSKPIDWYYGYTEFAAGAGLETLWPKTPDAAESEDIRIFYRLDVNPDGDFFDGRWLEVQENIKRSAAAYWGDSADTFTFDRFTLDNGENLYCYSFVVYRLDEKLVCQVAYRLSDTILVEYIGVQPLKPHERIGESHDVMLRVPYMAAFVDTSAELEEAQSDPETFYGRENWDFPQLHNPFAVARAYDRNAACSPYMLFTGAQ